MLCYGETEGGRLLGLLFRKRGHSGGQYDVTHGTQSIKMDLVQSNQSFTSKEGSISDTYMQHCTCEDVHRKSFVQSKWYQKMLLGPIGVFKKAKCKIISCAP